MSDMDPAPSRKENRNKTVRLKRYYVRETVVPFEEDFQHEFKGHCNLAVEEIPPWTVMPGTDRRTRAPVSRAINGFLNSGQGGTIYLGIIDDGTVKGLNLTQYRQDHLLASVQDLMSRYNPPVELHRYRLKFVPVVELNCSDDDIRQVTSFDASKGIDPESRKRPHTLRTFKYCWCHKDAVAQYNVGVVACDYVVELSVKAWDHNDCRNKHAVGAMKAAPVHNDECGRAYFRQAGCLIQYTPQELVSISENTVKDYYEPKLQRLKDELHELRLKALNIS